MPHADAKSRIDWSRVMFGKYCNQLAVRLYDIFSNKYGLIIASHIYCKKVSLTVHF